MALQTRTLALVLVLLAGVVILGYGTYAYIEGKAPFAPADDAWTGVFLTNGQAYFGHYYSAPGDYVILREVYYVLATQLQSQDPKVPAQTQLTLQKLGSEIHGPKPEMRIAKAQILFIEELRSDSPLVQSIIQQKNAPPAQPAPQAPAATPVPTQAPQSPVASPPRSPSPSPR